MSDFQISEMNFNNDAEQRELMGKLAVKMAKVMELTTKLTKSGKNPTQHYSYVPATDVFEEVRKCLVEAKIAFFMHPVSDLEMITAVTIFNAEKKTNIWRQVYMMHLIDIETGFDLSVPWSSQGMVMNDDKSENKMATNAASTFFTKTFLIPTDNEVETNQNGNSDDYASRQKQQQQRQENRQQQGGNQQQRPPQEQSNQQQSQPQQSQPQQSQPQQSQPQQSQPQPQQKQQTPPLKEAEKPKPKPAQENERRQPKQPTEKPAPTKEPPNTAPPKASNPFSKEGEDFRKGQLAIFKSDMADRGFNLKNEDGSDKIENGKKVPDTKAIGAWLEEHGFSKAYDPIKHDEILEAVDLFLEQKATGIDATIEKFAGEAIIEEVEQSEEDDSTFEFET